MLRSLRSTPSVAQVLKSLTSVVLSVNNVKRLSAQDHEQVEKLKLKNTEYLFGLNPPKLHLSKRFLSLGIYNDEESLVGVLVLDDHPNVPCLPPWEWAYWLHNLYHIDYLTSMTTLWIHYAVWDRKYAHVFLKPILQYIYLNFEILEYVVMVCPPGMNKVTFIEDHATRTLPFGYMNPKTVQTLFIAKKENFVCQYTIRRAVEEDNDDLIAIIPKVLEDLYGQYYVSELLSLEESQRQIIVAEHRGNAVGVVLLNGSVNYELLNEEFELVPYNGLRMPDVDDEIISQSVSVTMMGMDEDIDRMSQIVIRNDYIEDKSSVDTDDGDLGSDDDYSLVNLSSSMLFDFLYDEQDVEDAGSVERDASATSIESQYSAIILNEEYQDHLYNFDRGESSTLSSSLAGDKRNITQSKVMAEIANIPMFHGEPNAFAMEIAAAVPEHENCQYYLFQAAFECFPDRDYCIVSFPSSSNPSCYLKRHFVRVVPRNYSVFPHELYVLHKNAIMGKRSVRVATRDDKTKVVELLSTSLKPMSIEEKFIDAVENEAYPYKAYVFLSEEQIVGCAVVGEEAEHEYLELHYNLKPWIDTKYNKFGMYGVLDSYVISPIFQRHQAFFLRELHRLSNFYVLFYRLKRYDYMFSHKSLPIINAISHMAPILPRQRPEYDKTISEQYELPNVLFTKHQPFALYISTPPLTSMPRLEVNQRIIVIGAGVTAIAFLESLLFSHTARSLITFTNVTAVSPHGICYHKQPNKVREMVFVSNGHLDRRHMDSICLKTYVHVVTGVMTGIDRKEKFITVNDDSFLPYDYLFLLCGEQFQKAPKKREVIKTKQEFPQNVFIINTEADAGNAFNTLKSLTTNNKQSTMVVFGHYLEAICCLAALLEFGVSGSSLVYVDPSSSELTTVESRHEHLTQFFNNKNVEEAVVNEILKQGITIYQDYNFVEWHFDDDKNIITSARFESKYKFIEIELSVLFLYHSKAVSARTFQAITRSGLVFNGHLVIDKENRTNDPYIYGAGPLTMYSKKYHAEHLMHKYFNGEEIGYELGQQMRRKLVPELYWDYPETKPLRRKPLIQHCHLPGNLHYLHVCKPGKPVPLDAAMNKGPYGKVLISGDCRKLDEQGYFRLHFNQYRTVETITCLTKFELNVQNLISLYGKHEALLNNLALRYDMKMVPDLFEYFKEAWTCAIYHSRFQILLDEFNKIFATMQTNDGRNLIDELRAKYEENGWKPLTKMQNDEIEELCTDTNYFKIIEKRVLYFLHENSMYLPMYAHQMLIRWIKHQVLTSPLFMMGNVKMRKKIKS